MNPIAWLVGLALPACGFPAAEGLPTPPPMIMSQIVRPASPNTALAAPAGFSPPPDIVTTASAMPAERLFSLVLKVAAGQPRVYQAALYPDLLQVHYVARSAVFNFPDRITVQVTRAGPGHSGLIVYSRSVYGRSDFGVNRQRLEAWMAALQTNIPSPNER
jgi:hypothetical protein